MAVNGHYVTRFKDCKLLKNGKLVEGDVWVRKGKIIDPLKLFYSERQLPDRVVNCSNLIAAPGFIDLQVNGAHGVDFSSFRNKDFQSTKDIKEGVCTVAKHLLEHGVTAFCPTIVTSTPDYYKSVLPAITPTRGGQDGAAVLGIHCEGPFISREKKGAHKEMFVQDTVSQEQLKDCYGSLDNVSIVTLAPELPGAFETIKWLSDQNVVVSLGHSMAQLHTAEKAINEGASFITHLFNAMLPFHHRDPGIVGLLTSLAVDRQVYYSMIADGNHTHETVQRIAYHANKLGAVLVTDAMAAMGLCDGIHPLGSMMVQLDGNTATISGTNTLAGSVASMDSCVRLFQKATACTPAEALMAASLHPAQLLNIADHKGKLECGYDADIVLLSEDLYPVMTCIAGEIVWEK